MNAIQLICNMEHVSWLDTHICDWTLLWWWLKFIS